MMLSGLRIVRLCVPPLARRVASGTRTGGTAVRVASSRPKPQKGRVWQRRRNRLSPPRNFNEEVQVTAQIQRVTFHNPETGYSVVRAAVDGEPSNVTLCGTMHGVREGQAFQLTGLWEQHAHYGEQLAIRDCEPISIEQLASATAGLALFLAKTVRGVGHKTANKIVDHFGDSALDVLSAQPHRLVEVTGISPRIAKLVEKAWDGHAAEQARRAALLGLGVPYIHLERVLERWAAAAPTIVAQEPYRLTSEAGLSFAVTDSVAAANVAGSGEELHGLHSVERYAAATVHALRESISKGNCCLPTSKLREASANILSSASLRDRKIAAEDVRYEVLTQAWEGLRERETLVTEHFAPVQSPHARPSNAFQAPEPVPEPEVMWYTSTVHAAESEVAASLTSLLGWRAGAGFAGEHHTTEAGRLLDDESLLDLNALKAQLRPKAAEVDGVVLSDEQLAAVATAVSPHGRGAIVTGGPGCGKTFIMKTVVQIMRERGWKVALAAPTGRAAQRLSELVGALDDDVESPEEQAAATTIHRLLEYKPPGGFTRNASNPIDADAVVVDESSMLDISLARELCSALGPKTHLVLIGDPDQLPSIGPGNVLSDAIRSGVLATRMLTTVFRQAAASSIISSAYSVNRGDFPTSAHMHVVGVDEFVYKCRAAAAAGAVNEGGDAGRAMRRAQLAGLTGGKDCVFVDTGGSIDAAAAAVESALVTLAPALGFSPTADVQVLTPGNKGPLGAKELNQKLRPLLNPRCIPMDRTTFPASIDYTGPSEGSLVSPQPLPWGVGDKVIQVVNNYDLDVFNGDIGVVTALHEGTDGTTKPSATVEFPTGARTAREVHYEGTKELRQLLPAWAITVHKSQGSEYEVVILPVTMQHWFVLSRNLLYTALTRSQALCIIVGERKAMHVALAKTEGGARFTGLKQQLQHRC